ncbi:hypothetical protein H2200_000593 [Cladophialophora chaetospira]|uniref:Transcription factor domain-containing protein n=1 Tax=Cladophialophora chaetospira TaxID=386627 RepID=A0AA38XNP8_9EURO|nr:hypothetical protein H2200_000593 [Cladophialophora chaetospira]
MAAEPRITPTSFITFTSPADMIADTNRNAVASHAAKIGRQRRHRNRVGLEPRRTSRSYLSWRAACPPDSRQDEPTKDDETRPAPLKEIPRSSQSPLDILGQGRNDPFANYAVSGFPSLVHEVVDHAVRHFWPGLTPARTRNAANPVNEAYLADIRSKPLAFYAYMVASAENYELLSGVSTQNKALSQLCLSYRVAFIQEMNQEIQDMTGPPSDELLGAITVLAANSVMFNGQVRLTPLTKVRCSRFRSPLSTAQFINVYSSRPFLSPHTEALVRLVILKGGLSKIKSPGVASVVALADLVVASQTNSQLFLLAMYPPHLSGLENLNSALSEIVNLWQDSLSVWRQLPMSETRRAQFVAAVGALVTVNHALEFYLQANRPETLFADIVNARNDCQYLLLSLPPAFSEPQYDQSLSEAMSDHIYEVTRIALRIYSNLVIFPMNPAGGTSSILAQALKDAIGQSDAAFLRQLLPHGCKRLLLWALTLGGLQADDDPLDEDKMRGWFLEQFVALSLSIGIVTWHQVKECLSSFLWSESVLTLAAWEFWSDAERKMGSTS